MKRCSRCEKECSCADCGERWPAIVMQFDHLPGEQKLFALGGAARKRGRSKLQGEMAKCDVLCTTCHTV